MTKSGVLPMALGKPRLSALLFCIILGLAPPSKIFAGKQDSENTRVDYGSAKQEIQNFEAVINNAITSAFSSSPFAVVNKAKGAYLQGYGFSFSFLINIHRAFINTPFGQVRTKADATPELKKRRIEDIKEKLIVLLQDNSEIFSQLRKEDCVTIVAFIEDRNFPDEPNTNKTIVLSVLKKDLDELGRKNDRLREFKQRIKIVEY